MKNYYIILEISSNASNEEIKRAYRKLSLIFHPDINKHSDAAERFIEIKKAYEILIDPIQRAAYDYFLNDFYVINPRPYDTPRERIVVYDDIPYAAGVAGTCERSDIMENPSQNEEVPLIKVFVWFSLAGSGVAVFFLILKLFSIFR